MLEKERWGGHVREREGGGAFREREGGHLEKGGAC